MRRKRQFWCKVSNYSAIAAGVMIILNRFFRRYLENIMDVVFLMGLIACILFLIAELMKFLLKKEKI